MVVSTLQLYVEWTRYKTKSVEQFELQKGHIMKINLQARVSLFAILLLAVSTLSSVQAQDTEQAIDIPYIVQKKALPRSVLELIQAPTFLYKRSWRKTENDEGISEIIERDGNFSILRYENEKGEISFSSYVGPFSMNSYWSKGQLKTLSAKNLELIETSVEGAIDGIAPQDISFSYRWDIENAGAERSYRRSIEVTGKTRVTINVNGEDYRLHAFNVNSSTKQIRGNWNKRRRSIYVPVIGAVVQSEWQIEGKGDWKMIQTKKFEVSKEVLARVKAASF